MATFGIIVLCLIVFGAGIAIGSMAASRYSSHIVIEQMIQEGYIKAEDAANFVDNYNKKNEKTKILSRRR